jgi:hypothetical protein
MAQAERDVGAKLDWLGVEHWNTDHPHIHVVARGKDHDGHDLVMARDYISQGLRARATNLATLELGPRSDLEIRRDLDAQVEADRWTKLDRALAREAARNDGIIYLRPGVAEAYARTARIGRMQKLERFGLAEALAPAQWRLSEDAEPIMRAPGELTLSSASTAGLPISASNGASRTLRSMAETRPRNSSGGLSRAGSTTSSRAPRMPLSTESTDGLTMFAWSISTLRATPRRSIVERRQFQDAVGRQQVALAVHSARPRDHCHGAAPPRPAPKR